MKPKTIDIIRDLALKYEQHDLEVAHDLMTVAHQERPAGQLITKKLLDYKYRLNCESAEAIELNKLINAGHVAIIPIGFRCFTAPQIKAKLGVTLSCSPFTYGFFTPDSVARVLSNPKIELSHNDGGLTHKVCIKIDGNKHPVHGRGIKFKLSSYEEIDSIVTNENIEGINKYLDATFGYYTLDVEHEFVMAHYNWHKFADVSHTKGVTCPVENLQNMNTILNRRIERMFDLCYKAKLIFFVYGETQNYNYMQVDKEFYSLNDFSKLEKVTHDKFGSKSLIIDINKVNDARELMDIAAKIT